MDSISTKYDREIRAAQNQSLFRAVNEKVKRLNIVFASLLDTFEIACECADRDCIQMLDIAPADYDAVRSNPRRFVVLPAHVDHEVETVVSDAGAYLVVEKVEAAAIVAENAAASTYE
jgi:hypothetical protein